MSPRREPKGGVGSNGYALRGASKRRVEKPSAKQQSALAAATATVDASNSEAVRTELVKWKFDGAEHSQEIDVSMLYTDQVQTVVRIEDADSQRPKVIGINYDKDLRTPEIASVIRKVTKTAIQSGELDGVANVRVSSSTQGSLSVDVIVEMDSAHRIDQGHPGAFTTSDGEWVREVGEDEPGDKGLTTYTPEAARAQFLIQQLHDSLNYDHSDSRQDVFQRGFWGHVHVSTKRGS